MISAYPAGPVPDGGKDPALCHASKRGCFRELLTIHFINREIFSMDFAWDGPAPKAGQFFMVRPRRSSVFLGRPLSVALWDPRADNADFARRKARRKGGASHLNSNTVRFLISLRGRGTAELAEIRAGETAELIGPLGNAWAGFLPSRKKPAALVGGGLGVAPLEALIAESPEGDFGFYAGFKSGFQNPEEKSALLGPAFTGAGNLIVATEDGKDGVKGRIPDFLEPEKYSCVCACGPEPMLKAVAARCKAAKVPCFVSLERRMACGVGACLGCAVTTVNGNRRCCADGPIFNAEELVFG